MKSLLQRINTWFDYLYTPCRVTFILVICSVFIFGTIVENNVVAVLIMMFILLIIIIRCLYLNGKFRK